jgi:multicomponent Na+:H+ antiporter subunit C
MDDVLGLVNYWAFIFLMMVGFYILISQGNLIKKIVGLSIFQTAVFILYISMGKIRGGTAPILTEGDPVYSNPLPHVLILTAIVVGVATTALGLSLVVRIHEAYGTVEEDEIHEIDSAQADREDRTLEVSEMDVRA